MKYKIGCHGQTLWFKKAQISWVGTANDCLNDYGIKIVNSMSMRVLNAKRPHAPIWT